MAILGAAGPHLAGEFSGSQMRVNDRDLSELQVVLNASRSEAMQHYHDNFYTDGPPPVGCPQLLIQ
jgi:hypothetical protein